MAFSFALDKKAIAQTNEITITNGEWPPYMSEHLPHYGFASHVVTEAFNASDVKVTWGFMPWQRALTLVEHGTWDASVGWVRTEQRAQIFLYTTPIFYQSRIMVLRIGAEFNWQDPNELKGRRLATTISSGYPRIQQLFNYSDTRTIRFPTYTHALRALLSGRVDGVPITGAVANYLIANEFTEEEASQFVTRGQSIETLPAFVIISRKIPNGPELVEKYNSGMQILHATGRYGELLNAFRNGFYDKPQN